MGLETAMVAMSVISGAAKMGMEYESAQAKERALDLQNTEVTLQSQQKQLSNFNVLQKTLDAQEAMMTTRGVAFNSPSFNAIQRDTLNTAAKGSKNLELEESLAKYNINLEKKNVRSTLYAQLFGDVVNLAFTGAKVAGGMPTLGSPSQLPQMEA